MNLSIFFFCSFILSFNSWNLSIRSSYELLLKVLGYEFLPWSLPSLALFLNLFLAYERGPRKYYVGYEIKTTIDSHELKVNTSVALAKSKGFVSPPACSIVLSSDKLSSCRRPFKAERKSTGPRMQVLL